MTTPTVFSQLRDLLVNDPEYAWAWHCNLAMAIDDELHVGHVNRNLATARIMSNFFGVDITKNKCWDVEISHVKG